MSKKETASGQKSPKQPAIFRQKRQGRQDTAFTVVDGQRIHLGIYGTPEAEKEYRRVVAAWNTGIISPKQTNTDVTVAELVLRFLQERQKKCHMTNGNMNAVLETSLFRSMATWIPPNLM